MESGGNLYVLEGLLAEDSFTGGLLDLHMLTTTGGRERSLEEYRGLLARCGFRISEVVPLGSWTRIIVGELS